MMMCHSQITIAGDHTFSIAAASLCDNLSAKVISASSVPVFETCLKVHLVGTIQPAIEAFIMAS